MQSSWHTIDGARVLAPSTDLPLNYQGDFDLNVAVRCAHGVLSIHTLDAPYLRLIRAIASHTSVAALGDLHFAEGSELAEFNAGCLVRAHLPLGTWVDVMTLDGRPEKRARPAMAIVGAPFEPISAITAA